MTVFTGTIETLTDDNGIFDKRIVMEEYFYTHEWKDGDLLEVQINNNGTICFYHVEPIVRHIEI
tara:strand:+ start:1287 stop:1478 length:192 start_codon:yes stop_codon:yes gene_type:complete